jgi:hypothetical protein
MERRIAERKGSRIPVIIERTDCERFGVTRDIAEGGVLLNTPSSLREGERVKLAFHEPEGVLLKEGTVVRRMSAQPNDPWRYLVALRFAS